MICGRTSDHGITHYKKFISGLLILTLALCLFPVRMTSASKLKYTVQSELTISGNREKFSSDEVYANYRYVKAGKIKACMLYRGVNPYDSTTLRAPYADRLIKRDKIKTVINLDRTSIPETIREETSPYYYKLWKKGKVKELNARIRLGDTTFQKKVAKGLRFMSRRKGPYYIHCKIGRDRTGYFCALLECFMGASYDEVIKDYMKSYENLHGKLGKEKYNKVKKETIIPVLKEITGSDKPHKVNLKVRSEKFIKKLGITAAEQKKLRKNLGK